MITKTLARPALLCENPVLGGLSVCFVLRWFGFLFCADMVWVSVLCWDGPGFCFCWDRLGFCFWWGVLLLFFSRHEALCMLDSDTISKPWVSWMLFEHRLQIKWAFCIDVIEISVTVTEYILWNMHTVSDLPCFITNRFQVYISGLLHHHCWGNRMMGNHVIVPKPVAQWWIWSYVQQLDSPRTVITNFRKLTTENCAYFMRYYVLQIYH